MKKLLFIGSLIISFQVVNCQQTFTVKDFLAGAENQESVVIQDQKLEFFKTNSHGLPLFEKLEFRTETNDFDWRKQEFLLRVSPNSRRQQKTQQQYQQTVKNMTAMEKDAAWSKAIKDRYELLTNFIFYNEILEIKEKQKILYKDKFTLLQRSTALPNFDILELIDAEDKEQTNLRQILDLENSIITFQKSMQRLYDTEEGIFIDSEMLIQVDQINIILNEIEIAEIYRHPSLEVLSANMYNNMLEYEWEEAKSRFSLGYFQVKYGFDPQENLRKNISIGFGFDIPLKGAARLDLNKLQVNILEAESQYKNADNELTDKKYSLYQQLNNLIKKYELVYDQLDNSQAEFALKEYSKIAEASPKAMLKLRENTLSKELMLMELNYEIVLTFIQYLDLSGYLIKKPFRNYLRKDLEQF